MKLLTKLLAIAVVTVMSGTASAKTAQNSNSGTLSSDITDSNALFSGSNLHSFTDILDLGFGIDNRVGLDNHTGTDNRTMVANTPRRAPVESPAQAAGIYDLLLALSDEPDAGAVLSADSSPDGSVIDLPALVVPGARVARVPETMARPSGDGVLFSVAALPQPGDWMTLLCGFMVVAFIARRKTSALAD